MAEQHDEIDIGRKTDKEIIDLILSTGNTSYFEILYDRYANKVYGKAIQMVHDRNMAQDLTHDILIKAFLKLNTFEGRSSFSTWLYQISYTVCIDYIRKKQKMKEHGLDEEEVTDPDENPEYERITESLLLDMKIGMLKTLLDRLPAQDKMLLLLKYQDNVSISELSVLTELSESAIKMKLKRARDRMRREYNKELTQS